MPSLRERVRRLQQERAELVTEARSIIDLAEEEDRALLQEEESRYDALWNDQESLVDRIQRLERQMEIESNLQEPDETRAGGREDMTHDPSGAEQRHNIQFESRGLREAMEVEPDFLTQPEWRGMALTLDPTYRSAYQRWLRNPQRVDGDQRPLIPQNIRELITPELRALQADADIYGGYMVPPMQMVDGLIQAIDNRVFMRQLATVYSVPNADSLGAVSLDNDPADPTWTSELNIGSEDSTMSLGRRELHPHPLAKYIKLSRTLLRKVPSVEALVNSRLGYKFSVTAENAYLNGSGAGEPLGIYTASDDGISTSRDVSTGNTTTELRFDGLIEAKYTLKTQYWNRARWNFHRDAVKQIAKLKDGEGQYLWRQSVRVGEPDMILGRPVDMSEYTPNTFSTGNYVGAYFDPAYYWIADSLLMDMQRLVELYAGSNQVGFIMRMESDGMPVLEEAFVRVTLA